MLEKNRKNLQKVLDTLSDAALELEDILESEDIYRDSLAADAAGDDEYNAAELVCDSLDEAVDGVNEAIDLIGEVLDEDYNIFSF